MSDNPQTTELSLWLSLVVGGMVIGFFICLTWQHRTQFSEDHHMKWMWYDHQWHNFSREGDICYENGVSIGACRPEEYFEGLVP